MYNCIFSGYCLEENCDQSCPTYAQTSYLLDRNGISMNSDVFRLPQSKYDWAISVLDNIHSDIAVVESKDSYLDAMLLTYCAICRNWRGSQLHCTVYNLKYNKYLDNMRSSWSSKRQEDTEYEYMKIFIESSKFLIISGMDYTNFKDFESQNLLNLLEYRHSDSFRTLIVCPSINHILGEGKFFSRLKMELENRAYGNVY